MYALRNYFFILTFLCAFQFTAQAQPTTADQYLQSCTAFLQRKISLSAIRDCSASLELKPGDAKAHYTRGLAYKEMSDNWSALSDVNATLKTYPDDPVAIGQRAMLHVEMYEYDLALADMTRILALKPNDPAALYQRSILHEKMNKPDLALADVLKLAAKLPNDPRVKQRAALLGKYAGPHTFAGRYLETDLNKTLAASPELDKLKADIAVLKGKKLATEADFTSTLKFVFDSLGKDSPLAKYFTSSSRYRDLYELTVECLNRFPDNFYCNAIAWDESRATTDRPLYSGSVLSTYINESSMKVSGGLLKSGPNLSPKLKFALFNNQELHYMVADNYQRSLEMASQIEKLGPEYIDTVLKIRIRANKALKKYDLALADLDRLLALKAQGKTRIYVKEHERAEILNLLNKPNDALKAADAVLLKEPEDWIANLNKARAYRRLKKYDLALAEMNKIFARYPNAMYIHEERSLIYRETKDLPKAYADEAIASRKL